VDKAVAGCMRAQALAPGSSEAASLRKELEASAQPADWQQLQERAAARYAAKQYVAAAQAYEWVAKKPGATAVEAAKALSNQGMCLLSAQQYRAAFEVCAASLRVATGLRQLPESFEEWLADVTLQGGSQEACVLLLVMKSLGRMASCEAHMKQYCSALALYSNAAVIAKAAGRDKDADAFEADAAHMQQAIHADCTSPVDAGCSLNASAMAVSAPGG
jgi:tetratricopeptide (TPR) repeat protein